MRNYGWKPYVPVSVRRRRAEKRTGELVKRGINLLPVQAEGRKIAKTFWGEAWCRHLESFSDYSNRLPRGRSYLRNGSVCHLDIKEGLIEALVIGSGLYSICISVKPLAEKTWEEVKKRCSGEIASVIELLQGRISESVMDAVTQRKNGIFPLPGEIEIECDCPDWAVLCKHAAAALYGAGTRLDEKPELLFLLRGVSHKELITESADIASSENRGGSGRIDESEIPGVFGIEISEGTPTETGAASSKKKQRRTRKNIGREDIVKIRARLGMSRARFAELMEVSPSSVSNWEKKEGPLNLNAHNREKLGEVKRLSRKKAWKKLGADKT